MRLLGGVPFVNVDFVRGRPQKWAVFLSFLFFLLYAFCAFFASVQKMKPPVLFLRLLSFPLHNVASLCPLESDDACGLSFSFSLDAGHAVPVQRGRHRRPWQRVTGCAHWRHTFPAQRTQMKCVHPLQTERGHISHRHSFSSPFQPIVDCATRAWRALLAFCQCAVSIASVIAR